MMGKIEQTKASAHSKIELAIEALERAPLHNRKLIEQLKAISFKLVKEATGEQVRRV